MMRIGRLLALLLLAAATAAGADERILDFRSDVEVQADAGMTVTETIRVRAEGDRIRHGIYRDFPTDYRDDYGNRVRVEFGALAARRDGAPEAMRSERYGNGVRVWLGSAASEVAPGEHEYEIVYRTQRQLGFFADHDELYWNATGNGWDFPIDHAEAAVTLPGDVDAAQISVHAYTGAQGARGTAWRGSADRASHAVFRTTQGLSAREGLTIVVAFPKRVVAAPSTERRMAWLIADNTHILVGLCGLLVVLVYLGRAWWTLGRDPRGGPIVPQYEAPDGWSPAELRYVERMAYDDRCFAADLVDLGVRGAVEIRQAGGGYALARRRATTDAIAPVERALFDGLLGESDELTLESSQHAIIGGARTAHRSAIEAARGKGWFRANTGTFAVGALLALLTIYVVDATSGALPIQDSRGKTIPSLVLLLFSLFPIVFASIAIAAIGSIAAARRRVPARSAAATAVRYALAAIPLALGATIGLPGGAFGVLLAALLIAALAVAGVLLPAPTAAGRKLLDRIAGLRLYLGVAERESLARQQAPEMTPREFERFLPYALALDVEKTWCDRFAAAVGPAAAAAAATSLTWYQGATAASFSSFASDIGSSLNSTISSSATAPGSSSGGSSSGGSSGGGGGGGGGGGW